MVSLRDFVAETLKQIADGVEAAQEYMADKGAVINPASSSSRGDTPFDRATGRRGHDVQFDVAIATTEGTETKGCIGVFVPGLALGSTGQSAATEVAVSRIKFGVFALLPMQPGYEPDP